MKVQSRLVNRVSRFLRRQRVAGQDLVVAVSGGPDSIGLLHALLLLRECRVAGRLVIAHLNHQLRGEESDSDARFVEELHAKLLDEGIGALELRGERVDVAAAAKKDGTNLEATARRIRYDWLVRVAREANIGFVATGHTADDQAETMLHRLLRGAGLKGLRGIPARRHLSQGVEVVRPLLRVTREKILAFLQEHNQPFRVDSSNADPRFMRNRIRLELLPYLRENYNPKIVKLLRHLSKQVDRAYRTEREQAEGLLAAVEKPRAGHLLIFDRAKLKNASRHLVREMFRLVWSREGWPENDMDFEAWERLASLAQGKVVAIDFPGGIRAALHERVVQVGAVR